MSGTHAPAVSKSRSSRGIVLFLWVWFWRITLVVSLGYAWYCFYVPKNAIAWEDEYPSATQLAEQSGKPMILFFTGKWCVPCRIMKRTVWADDQVETKVNASFIPVLVNVSEDESSETRERYKVYVTPTTIITDSEGHVIDEVRGAMSKSEFLKLLEKPLVQNYLNAG